MAYLARLLTWKFNAAVAVTVAWCWYFPWPSEDPAVRLVRLQSPMWHEVLRAWSLVSPGVIVLILALIAESVRAGVVRVVRLGGIRARGAAGLAAVAGRPRPVARDRRAAPSDAVRGGPEPPLAGDTEEGPVHRAPDPGRGRHRQDDELHAPLHAAAADVAGRQRGEAGGGALPGGQGRLLLRREEDAGCLQAFGRLHRAEHEAGRLRLEPAGGAVAGQLVAGRDDRVAAEPALRQGEGAVLAAGVHERRAVGDRAEAAGSIRRG